MQVNSSHSDFAGLGQTLLDTKTMDDYARRRAALAPFRAELALLMIGLRKAEIVGNNGRPGDPAELCDTCGATLIANGLYIDGAIQGAGGTWANMCMQCFLARGKGLGWGVGQLYAHDSVGWQCIAGGNPQPQEDEEE